MCSRTIAKLSSAKIQDFPGEQGQDPGCSWEQPGRHTCSTSWTAVRHRINSHFNQTLFSMHKAVHLPMKRNPYNFTQSMRRCLSEFYHDVHGTTSVEKWCMCHWLFLTISNPHNHGVQRPEKRKLHDAISRAGWLHQMQFNLRCSEYLVAWWLWLMVSTRCAAFNIAIGSGILYAIAGFTPTCHGLIVAIKTCSVYLLSSPYIALWVPVQWAMNSIQSY